MAQAWTPEQHAKFKATMAEKNAAKKAAKEAVAAKRTAKPKRTRKPRKGAVVDFPLHVIPARPPAKPKAEMVVKPREGDKIALAIELARAITLLLK